MKSLPRNLNSRQPLPNLSRPKRIQLLKKKSRRTILLKKFDRSSNVSLYLTLIPYFNRSKLNLHLLHKRKLRKTIRSRVNSHKLRSRNNNLQINKIFHKFSIMLYLNGNIVDILSSIMLITLITIAMQIILTNQNTQFIIWLIETFKAKGLHVKEDKSQESSITKKKTLDQGILIKIGGWAPKK